MFVLCRVARPRNRCKDCLVIFGVPLIIILLLSFANCKFPILPTEYVDTCVVFPWVTNGGDTPVDSYGVVIDAGSVHSTLSVYKWGEKVNGTGKPTEIFNCELNATSGISSFVAKPKDVQNYLLDSPCMKTALGKIPSDAKTSNRSLVFLGATAGLRTVRATNPKGAENLLRQSAIALSRTGLSYYPKTGFASILTGKEEGVMGWITSNYLNGSFADGGAVNEATIGALDWGGASSQITFLPKDPQQANMKVTLYGKVYHLFTQSSMCYGQEEALKRYHVQLIWEAYKKNEEQLVTKPLFSPCQPKDNAIDAGYKLKVRPD